MNLPKFDVRYISTLSGYIAEAEERLNNIADDVNEYYDSKSERWQESERGEAYQNAIGTLELIRDAVEQMNSDLQDLEDAIREN